MSIIAFDGNQKANKFTCTRHTRLWRKWATIMMIDAISTVSCWTKSLLDDHNILMRQPLFHTKFKIINLFHFRLTFLVWHRFMIQNWCTRDEGRDDENNARGCLKINHAVFLYYVFYRLTFWLILLELRPTFFLAHLLFVHKPIIFIGLLHTV